MNCKNCNNELNGSRYCPSCGQRFVEQFTIKNSLSILFEALDLRRGIFRTLTYLFFKPNKLITDFLEGKTKPYVHPFAFFILCIGLGYLISELKLFDFPGYEGDQVREQLAAGIPTIIASLIGGIIPFYKKPIIELTFINMYWTAGMVLTILLSELLDHFFWIYEINLGLDQLLFLAIAFTFYFYGSVFKYRLHVSLINILLILGLNILINFFLFPGVSDTKIFSEYESLPSWAKTLIWQQDEKIAGLSLADNVENSIIIKDLTNDSIRDIAMLTTDTTNTYYVALLQYKEHEIQVLSLHDLFPASIDQGVLAWEPLPMNGLLIYFQNNVDVKIKWNGNHYFAEQFRPRSAKNP